MKQLSELKSKMDEVKKRLDSITVSEENDCARVVVNGNRKVTAITLKQALDSSNEQRLVEAINEALTRSEAVMQSEMKGIMPNIPGLS
jgi:hypothetical protein